MPHANGVSEGRTKKHAVLKGGALQTCLNHLGLDFTSSFTCEPST